MRRSTAVKLTLLPMLATAAVASADPPPTAGPAAPPTAGQADPPTAGQSAPPTAGPGAAPYVPGDVLDRIPPDDGYGEDPQLAPPGLAEPALAPPGMTPSILELDCDSDPNWRMRIDCADETDVYITGGVVRGGFGGYFYSGYSGGG